MAQIPRIHRFDFGSLRDFRGPLAMQSPFPDDAEEVPVAPPPPSFSEADLEAARMAGRREGYAEGFTAGQAETRAAADQQAEALNAYIARMVENQDALADLYRALLTQEAQHLGALALAIARKVAGEAIDARGDAAILAMAEQCMPVIFSKPQLSVSLHPDRLDAVAAPLMDRLRSHGFRGDINFQGDPDCSNADLRVRWQGGEIHRSNAALWQEVEALLSRMPPAFTLPQSASPHPIGE